jgi:hypothetical protein
MAEMPFGGARIVHRLDNLVLGRKRSGNLKRKRPGCGKACGKPIMTGAGGSCGTGVKRHICAPFSGFGKVGFPNPLSQGNKLTGN